MPFMVGVAPIRRTLRYLNAGKLILKERIKVFTINYNVKEDHHEGARDFAFWHLAQIQHKNPNVQVAAFKNLTPSPFIRCFTAAGESILIDLEGRKKEDILEHVIQVLGKSEDLLEKEALAQEKKENPANFGYMCEKHCICTVPGQLPCPSLVPLPYHYRGRYLKYKQEELEEIVKQREQASS